jgi:tripartite-type tricarboxylate transporter receptor subunit TctC
LITAIRLLPALFAAAGFHAALAEDYPQRPVRVINTFGAPGGAPDVISRTIGAKLTQTWGVQVVVDPRPGAAGLLATEIASKATPDGYTLLLVSPSHAINPALYRKIPYDPVKDFVPITQVAEVPNIVSAYPGLGVHSIKELIALAKAKPGTLTFSSGGIGNFSHMGLELLAIQAGIKLTHVPYRGVGPATTAVLSGEVQLMYNNAATAIEHVRGGKLNALGVGEPKRIDGLSDIPAIAETVPGFEMAAWVGIFVPAKIPQPIVDRLTKEIAAFLEDPATKKYFEQQFIVSAYKNPAQFQQYIKADLDRWTSVVKTAGIKGE